MLSSILGTDQYDMDIGGVSSDFHAFLTLAHTTVTSVTSFQIYVSFSSFYQCDLYLVRGRLVQLCGTTARWLCDEWCRQMLRVMVALSMRSVPFVGLLWVNLCKKWSVLWTSMTVRLLMRFSSVIFNEFFKFFSVSQEKGFFVKRYPLWIRSRNWSLSFFLHFFILQLLSLLCSLTMRQKAFSEAFVYAVMFQLCVWLL